MYVSETVPRRGIPFVVLHGGHKPHPEFRLQPPERVLMAGAR